MTAVVAFAALFVVAGAVAAWHYFGVVAEDQAMQANKLADWEARLRRQTAGYPLGGCRSVAECERNRATVAEMLAAFEAMEPQANRWEGEG